MQGNHRIVTLDLARGTAVLAMIVVHTLWMYGDIDTQSSGFGLGVQLLGKGTVAFLLAMGASFMWSRDQSLGGAVRRGFALLAAGYVLNILKFIVPIAVGTMPESFVEAYGWHSPLEARQLLYLVGTGDILHLAGLSLIFMGLARRGIRDRRGYLALALGVAAATYALRGIRVGVVGVDYLLDLLWGVNYNVYFPVFPWLTGCFVGMYYGAYFLETGRDLDRLYRQVLRIGAAMLVVGGALVAYDPGTHMHDFFHMGGGGSLYATGIILVVGWGIRRLEERFGRGRLTRVLEYCSARVTTLYVIQWTLICWGMGLVGYHTLSFGELLLAVPVTLSLTFLAQWALDGVLARRRARRPELASAT